VLEALIQYYHLIKKGTGMENSRLIKRYANRKLYDTTQSCYVTLEEIASVIREGNDVTVIDNKTKEDITYRTLIQLLHVLETKKALEGGRKENLNKVIRSEGGVFFSYINALENAQKRDTAISEPREFAAQASESAEISSPIITQK
jgi:polyhydroxyalkanoate synthesis repressor PhaR